LARVFVSRQLPGHGVERLRAVADVEVWPDPTPPPPDELLKAVSNADGLLTMLTERIDAPLLDLAPNLRIVANMAVGYDNIDIAAATERGVIVTNTPGVLVEATAELAFALLLASARRLVEGERIVREGRWPPWRPDFHLGKQLAGATLGIVGLGAIGEAVARRARGFDMRLVHFSRTRRSAVERELGLTYLSLEELLGQSDFVTLHIALTPETRHLIGAEQLALMKQDAILINTARGPIVDQAALVEALKEHRIGGAALDVFEVEPLPPNDPLLRLDNVLVAPHIGSATLATRTRMADLAVDNLIAYFKGERPLTMVNPDVWGS
jgi:glyoxylate reductase